MAEWILLVMCITWTPFLLWMLIHMIRNPYRTTAHQTYAVIRRKPKKDKHG